METLDINAIKATLPHGYPMLLVDRVLECEPGQRIRGLKNVTYNEPYFPGHFPGYPVMPGVLVIEALAQVSAILAYRSNLAKSDGKQIFFFAGINDARFKRQVVPGDTLILESSVKRIVRGIGIYDVRATVEGKVACEAELMAVLRDLAAGAPGPVPGGGA